MPPTPAPARREETDGAFLRLLLIGAVALISLGAFENLAVTTMMPLVAEELDGLRLYPLAMGLPLAAHIAATALGGIWVDARSLRAPLVAGTALFAAGLVVAGVAPTMTLVAFGRGIGGLGTGLMVVALYAAVGALVPAARRPRFFAWFSAAWVVPSLVGPALAGYAAQYLSWRWVFLAVAPLALAALAGLRPLLAATAPAPAASDRAERRADVGRRVRGVLLPAVLVAVALAILQRGADGGWVLTLVSLGVVAALLPRLLPAGTFRLRPGVPAVVATRMLVNGTIIAMEAFLPLFLRREAGWEPGPAGLVLTVGSVAWATGAWWQGRLTEPRRRYRASVAGAILVAAGVAIASLVAVPGVNAAVALLGWVFAGFGMGMTFSAMAVLALDLTPVERHGEISAALQIGDGAGAALALAAFGASFTALLGTGMDPFLPGFAMMLLVALLAVVAARRVPDLTDEGPAAAGASR